MRVDILKFEGRALPNEFIDKLNTIERVFDIKHVSDSNKVKRLSYLDRQMTNIMLNQSSL